MAQPVLATSPTPASPPPGVSWSRIGRELLFSGVVLTPLLLYPLGRDQGLFAYSGQVILDGGVPYQDLFDHKGPAIYYAYAVMERLFGESVLGVRLFFWFLALAGSQMAAALAHRLFAVSARLPAALCFSMFASQPSEAGSWVTAQAEDLLLALYLATVLLLVHYQQRNRPGLLVIAGVFLGTAVMIKPTAIVCALTIGGCAIGYWLWHERWGLVRIATSTAWSTLGFLIPPVAFIVYLAQHGAWPDFYQSVIEFNCLYARQREGDLAEAATVFWLFFKGGAFLGVIGYGYVSPKSRYAGFLLLSVVVAGLATVIWQGKYRVLYQWTPMIGAWAVFAGVAIAGLQRDMLRRIADTRWQWAFRLAFLTAGTVAIAPNLACLTMTWTRVAKLMSGRITLAEFQGDFRTGSDCWKEIQPVALYVQSHTEPADAVLVWGNDVLINFVSNRRSPTRFAMNRPLGFSPRVSEYRNEFLQEIRRNPPKYVLVANEQCFFSFDRPAPELLKDFPDFADFLSEHYDQEAAIGIFDILRRVDPNPRTAPRKES